MHRGMDPEFPASLSPRGHRPACCARSWVSTGVVVTDSIDMRAIADRWAPAEAAVLAVRAGADLVIDGFNLTHRREHPARALVAALRSADRRRTPRPEPRTPRSSAVEIGRT